jgi:phage-related protein
VPRFNAGSATLSVVPSLRGFEPALKSQLKRVNLTHQVRISPDMQRFGTDLKKELERFHATLRVGVELDTAGLGQRLQAELERVDARVRVPIDIDGTALSAQLRAQLAALPRDAIRVPVQLDVDRAGLTGLRGQVAAQKLTSKVHLDTSQAGAALRGIATLSGAAFAALATQAAVGGLLAVAGAAATAGGALALLPAAAVAAAAPIAAIVIGAQGIGDAFKAATAATKDSASAAASSAAAQQAAAHQVQAAERGVETASRSVETAQRGVAAAIEGVADAQRGVETANRRVEDAQRGVTDAVARSQDAERDYADAQRATLAARQDVNDALREATRSLADLNAELANAPLDEEDAVLAVERAQLRLNETLAAGSEATELDRKEADLAHRQAVARLDDVRTRNARLATDVAAANAAGVEGSDQVLAARDRVVASVRGEESAQRALAGAQQGVADSQRDVLDAQQGVADAQRDLRDAEQGVADAQRDVVDAQRGVVDAQQALTEATVAASAALAKQSPAAEALSQAMAKLSPNARDFVDQMRALGPAWTGLRLDVQDQLFRGLGDSITALARVQLPVLREGLSDLAGDLNATAREVIGVFARPAAVSDFAAMLGQIRSALDGATQGAAPLAQAFIDIAAVGSTFLPELGTAIGDAAQRFGDFIAQARADGSLQQFIQTAMTAFGQLADVVKQVGSILFSVLQAGAGTGGTLLDALAAGLGQIAGFLNSPAGQGALEAFFAGVATAIQVLAPLITTVAEALLGTVGPALAGLAVQLAPIAQVLLTALADALKVVAPLVPVLGDAITSMVSALLPLLPTLGSLITQLLPPFATLMVALGQALAPLIPVFADLIVNLLPPWHALLTQLLPILSQLVVTVGEALVQALVGLVPMLMQVAQMLFPALMQVVQALAPLLPVLVEAFLGILGALLPLIGPLLKIVQMLLPPLVSVVQMLIPFVVQLATALGDALLQAFELLLPIFPVLVDAVGRIIAAILPLLPIVIDLALQLLPPLLAAFGALVPVIEAILPAVAGLIEQIAPLIGQILEKLTPALLWLADRATWVFQTVAGIVTWAITNVIEPLLSGLIGAFGALGTALQWTYDNVIKPLVIDPLAAAASWLWDDVLSPVFGRIEDGFSALGTAMQWAYDNIIKPLVIDPLATAASWLWNDVLSPTFGWIKDSFDGLGTAMQWVVDNVIKPLVIDPFATAISGLKGVFETVVDAIGRAWDGLKEIARGPINFVIGTVLNNGLLKAFNAVVGFFGLDSWHINDLPLVGAENSSAPTQSGRGGKSWAAADGGQVPSFAAGGKIPGPFIGPRADNVPGVVGRTPIRVNPREWIHPVDSVDYYGDENMRLLQTRRIDRGALELAVAMTPGLAGGGQVQGFASGGQTFPQLDGIRKKLFPGSVLTDALRPGARDMHGRGMAIDIGWPGNTQAGLMPIAAKLAAAYPQSTELIHKPNASIKNGRVTAPPSPWGQLVWDQHADHVHWGMTPEALLGGQASGDGLSGISGLFTDPLGYIKDAYTGLLGKLGDSSIGRLGKAVPNRIYDGMKEWMGDKVSGIGSKIAGLLGLGNDDGDSSGGGDIKAIFQRVAGRYGWGSGPEWNALDRLEMREAGYNPNAQNPTSTAYGLGQFLNSTWAGVGGTKTSDPELQSDYMMRYIRQRFGSPSKALAFHLAHNYYGAGGQADPALLFDSGGQLPPGFNTVYNGTGQTEFLQRIESPQPLPAELRSGGDVNGLVVHGDLITQDVPELMRRQQAAARAAQVRAGLRARSQ